MTVIVDFLPLDRVALLAQVVAYLEHLHAGETAPVQEGGIGMRSGQIPMDLQASPKNTSGATVVYLFDQDADAYRSLIHHLGHLRETEWLTGEQIEEKLWRLTCELTLAPSEFAAAAERQARADVFLASVLHPLESYEVLFNVEDIAPPANPVEIWDSCLLTGTAAVLQPFFAEAPPPVVAEDSRPFVGKAVLRLDVVGTAVSPVIERARALGIHRISVLRTFLGQHWQVSPAQLLFRLGDYALARPLSCQSGGRYSWRRPSSAAAELDLHPGLGEQLGRMQELYRLLPRCHPTLQSVAERACERIGRGLACHHWPDDALRDYTTALEVLLVSPDERGISILVPYRMVALADLNAQPVIHPTAIRYAYDRRSIVAHQGHEGAATPEATKSMLAAATDCLGWLMNYAASQPTASHQELLASLDTLPIRMKVLDWIKNLKDEWSNGLRRGIESLPKN